MKLTTILASLSGALFALASAAYLYVWFAGGRFLEKRYETPAEEITLPITPEEIAEGERIAGFAGCTGCHAGDLNGKDFGEALFTYRMRTANLPRLAKDWSDADFARAIRRGVKPDGRSVNGMPSPSFYDMRDEDVAKIVAFIRTKSDLGEEAPPNRTWILGRLEFLKGLYLPEATGIDQTRPRRAYDMTKPVERGEYLARIACSECHGLDFKGAAVPEGTVPDLGIAAAYPLEDFRHLMRTGEPLGGRDLRLMDDVARGRFIHFTDAEIDALHAFFKARG